jgi:CRISPR system Cascade subunit CasC
MSTFIQLHILTSYPPSNLNRDDLGRPKTAVMGGQQRLRISSQCLKRAWRTSDVFKQALSENMGVRTKEMGEKILQAFVSGNSLKNILDERLKNDKKKIEEEIAKKWAKGIVAAFVDKIGKNKEDSDETQTKEEEAENKGKKAKSKEIILKTDQLVFYNNLEIEYIDILLDKLRNEKREPSKEELKNLLVKKSPSVDVGMFGRMLANSPDKATEAAVQVAHAVTVHKAAVEDDYFSAVDDLNAGVEHSGSAHLGEMEFGAGLYYLYVCINKDLLIENLEGDPALAGKAIQALAEAAVTVSPSGKQNSYASREQALFVLAEKGEFQPRSLSAAFLKPVDAKDIEQEAVSVLTETRDKLDKVFERRNASYAMRVMKGEGKLSELLKFLSE